MSFDFEAAIAAVKAAATAPATIADNGVPHVARKRPAPRRSNAPRVPLSQMAAETLNLPSYEPTTCYCAAKLAKMLRADSHAKGTPMRLVEAVREAHTLIDGDPSMHECEQSV